MIEFITQPWPWYVAGPLIGLMIPLLLISSGRAFGVSSSLQHLCAAALPGRSVYFKYDWKGKGLWNLVFVFGILIGGFVGGVLLQNPDPIALSQATITDLMDLGIRDFDGFVPSDIFAWSNVASVPGFFAIVIGGFLVGFGARYAGGCTSGHSIMGLATLQKASLIATVCFFIGGLFVTFVILPMLL